MAEVVNDIIRMSPEEFQKVSEYVMMHDGDEQATCKALRLIGVPKHDIDELVRLCKPIDVKVVYA